MVIDTEKLIQQKKITADKLTKLQQKHNVIFEYARNYGKQICTKFSLPDAVLVLTTCENGMAQPWLFYRTGTILI